MAYTGCHIGPLNKALALHPQRVEGKNDNEAMKKIVYDTRRLTNEAHLFIPRKAGKTEFGASIDFSETVVLGDSNSQALICANSKDQAKIAFKAVAKFAQQIDPASMKKGGGKFLRVTADEVNFRPGFVRTGSIKVMSAGGKKKDGLYASVVHADEHGSASYVNNHSDMQELVEVCAGSMGPRRERLLLHTTTAGLVNEGPYQIQLRNVENMLLDEGHPIPNIPLKEWEEKATDEEREALRTAEDKWFAFLLRLDPWDFENDNLDDLNRDELFRKVNRSIGTTVQPTWYRERLHDAATKGADTRKEVLTKDFNIWQTDRIVEWINGDEIRKLQVPMRIEDCKAKDGWIVLTGMDFTNVGDDFQASSYLAVRAAENGGREFFADMDAWVSEEAVQKSPLKNLFEQWDRDGWLHIVRGSVLSPSLPVDRIVNLRNEFGVSMMGFGYDSFKSKEPINLIKSWLLGFKIRPQDIGNYLMPIQQTFGGMSPLIDQLTYSIRCEHPLIRFSENPIWPWEFQNCMLIDNPAYELKKVVKAKQEGKVDNVQSLCNAYGVYERLSTLVVK